MRYSFVLDLGTTGVKGFVFTETGEQIGRVYERLEKSFPEQGWVEFEPKILVDMCFDVLRRALQEAHVSASECTLGITNQRETVVVWDSRTGKAVYPAIGWEDTRTRDWCEEFVAANPKRAQKIRERTGLFVDAYFTAPKLRWILDHAVKSNEHVLAGTLDTWVLWHLTGEYMTDYTNACRTLLYDPRTYGFDLCNYFDIPGRMLTPIIHPSKSKFGITKKEIFGTGIPVRAIVGDQQSSLYAAGTDIGTTKITYGTGAFLMTLLGGTFQLVDDLYTTSALGPNGIQWYALEAKVDDVVKRVEQYPEGSREYTDALRAIAKDVDGIMKKFPSKPTSCVVDGGISKRDELLRMQSDVSGCKMVRQITTDATALGVHKLLVGDN